MNQKLKNYIGIVDFLGKALGEDTEVALHDLSNLESSIIAIANGHISNRKVGAPATNLVLKTVQNKGKNKDYIHNYKGVSDTGLEVRSSTYFIKDEEEIIGMLCINKDVSKLVELKSVVDNILNVGSDNLQNSNMTESFSQNSEDLKSKSINDIVKSFNIPPMRMSPEEKIDVVKTLDESGVFLIKGAVSDVAKILSVSEPTIYRYLNIIKKD